MPRIAKVLNEQEKSEIVQMYPLLSIAKIALIFHCHPKLIMETLDDAGIQREKYKKQEADEWNGNPKKQYSDITLTKATPEFIDYILYTMAEAGRMEGDPIKNYEILKRKNPFTGVKRTTTKIVR